jgi:hypothetical protein
MTNWTRRLAFGLLCLALVRSGGYTQDKPPMVESPAAVPPPPAIPTVSVPAQASPVAPGGRPATVEQLIERLEQLRVQRKNLEDQEKVVADLLRDALQKQKVRLNKLGVEDTAPPPRAKTVEVFAPPYFIF